MTELTTWLGTQLLVMRMIFPEPSFLMRCVMACVWLLAGKTHAQIDDMAVQKNNADTALITEPANAGWAFYIDNDIFNPRPRDRDYTGGMSISMAGQRAATWPISIDPLLGFINNIFGLQQENHAAGIYQMHGLQLGAAAFTPGDITVAEIIPGDRPYAGLVYFANSRLTIDAKNPDAVAQTALIIGLLGTSLLPGVQKVFHRDMGSDEPQGWSHQISAGGEPTFRYSYAQQYLLASDERGNLRYEIKPSFEIGAGFITDASVALSARWGRISTPWWSFAPDRSEYFSQPSTGLAYAPTAASKELYVWAGAKMKAHVYNVFLQGQFRNSDVTYDPGDIRWLMAAAWAGVTGQVSRYYWLSWELRYQTSELRIEPGDRPVVWGRIMINRYF